MNTRFHIECGGGLGDLIMVYCCDNREGNMLSSDSNATPWFRRLKDFKLKHPEFTTVVNLCNHNSSAKELIELDPYIDEINHIPWVSPIGARLDLESRFNCRCIYKAFDINDYIEEDTAVRMDSQDEMVINSLPHQYVVMHPFARGSEREVLREKHWAEMADMLVSRGTNVVALGKSYTLNVDGGHYIEEKLSYSHDRFINLIDKCTVRAAVNIIFNAAGFIGTHSSMILAAWLKKIRSVCFIPGRTALMSFWEGDDPTVWGLKQKFNKTEYIHGNVVPESLFEAVNWVTR